MKKIINFIIDKQILTLILVVVFLLLFFFQHKHYRPNSKKKYDYTKPVNIPHGWAE